MAPFIFWSVLAVATTLYLATDRNAPRKRLLWPILLLGISGLFLGFFLWAAKPDFVIGLGIALVVLLITAVNMFKVRFCAGCGATSGLFSRGVLPPSHCSKCGAPLK